MGHRALLRGEADARLTLLDPQRKAVLDQQLTQASQARMPVATPLPAATPVRATPIVKQTAQSKPVAVATAPGRDTASQAANKAPEPRKKKEKNIPLEIVKIEHYGMFGLGKGANKALEGQIKAVLALIQTQFRDTRLRTNDECQLRQYINDYLSV